MTLLIECAPLVTEPASTDDSPQPFRFLDLPGEIRNIIYQWALGACGSKDFELETEEGTLYASTLPCTALLRTCKQIHQETKDLPYELHAFDLRDNIAKMSDICPFWSKIRHFSNINIYLDEEANFEEVLAVLKDPNFAVDTLDLKFEYEIPDLASVMKRLEEADAKIKEMIKVTIAFPVEQVLYKELAEEAITNAVTGMQGYKEAGTFSEWMTDDLDRRVFTMISLNIGEMGLSSSSLGM